MVTVSCTAAIVVCGTPAPSPPSTIAVGSRRSSFGQRRAAARHGRDQSRTPSSCADATTSDSEPRAAIGRRNVPPIAPRSAFQLNGFAEPSIATTPDAPNAAAARTIAPTFPGSCRPASTSTSGRSVTVAMTTRTSVGRARAIATTPEGCCTGLIAASTWSLTIRTRPPRFLTSLAMRASGREDVVQLLFRERRDLHAECRRGALPARGARRPAGPRWRGRRARTGRPPLSPDAPRAPGRGIASRSRSGGC